jgi:hypothetical protein
VHLGVTCLALLVGGEHLFDSNVADLNSLGPLPVGNCPESMPLVLEVPHPADCRLLLGHGSQPAGLANPPPKGWCSSEIAASLSLITSDLSDPFASAVMLSLFNSQLYWAKTIP